MDRNNTIESKIKRYTALAGGITAIAGVANAQVVYTDINPDQLVTGNGGMYSLDVDNDGTVDFSLTTMVVTSSYTYYGMNISLQYDAAVVSPAASGNSMMTSYSSGVANVPVGSAIGSSGSFSSASGFLGYSLTYSITGSLSTSGSFSGGNFINGEGFVGLKFDISGDTHYGWARVEVTPDGTTLSVKDYAYESTANTAILSGNGANGPVGIETAENNVEIQNFNDKVKIKLSDELTNSVATITSITGQEVLSKSINNSIELIELNDLSSGIYMVSVNTDQGNFNKKIYIR